MFRILHRFFWVCLVIATTAGAVLGQAGATGTILGTINDNTGAMVPNAQVTIVNTATNVSRQVQTSSAGDFSVPDLQPARTPSP